ncbi:MAG: MFS transporter [Methylibium sp.]|uniref:MFS transporter n=1 Tax=Methylibium sp. TaxID=2067992 RepID=UPI0017DE821D|nr:MFS transporter [Methylibium sp.]MBA3596062.1 MFS transporter [Methylibium sp.]
MRFFAGRVAATMANQMLMVAIGWQMYTLTGSAWDLGLVGLFQFAPALALVLIAGHAADQLDRRRIVGLAMASQALVSVLLVAAALGGWASRELLLGLSVAIGCAKAFQMPAQQALLPLLVPDAVLPRAMAFNSAGMQAAVIGGPAIGGFLFVAGASATYGVCMLLFAAASVLFAGVRYTHIAPLREPMSLETVLAGFRFIRHRPVVLGAISLDLFAVLLGGATALLPMFAKDVLHVGPWGLGLLRGAPAAGALAMSVALSLWPFQRRVGRRMFAAVAVYGVSMLVFGLSTLFWLSMAALAVAGAADMVSVVIRQSLVQLETPNAMRGRVSAVNSIFIGASNQLGEFESGATAALLGPVGSVVLGGVGTLLIAGTWMKLFPDLARRERLRAEPP